MSYLGGYYVNQHVSQFDGSAYQASGCVRGALANGVDAVTGGARQYSAAYIKTRVLRREETDPDTPGWSIPDADLAMSRLGIEFANRSQDGWGRLVQDHESGLYLIVQGDSDRFPNGTCSGKFDGLHCIGVHPATRLFNGVEYWWIDDPICKVGRYEKRSTVYNYGAKLDPSMRFGTFTHGVPKQPKAVWGSDVPADIRAVNPSGLSVAAAIRKTGTDYKTAINMVDLETALKRAHIDYKTAVNPIDVRALLTWAARH